MSRLISAIFARLNDPAQVSPDRSSDSELIARFVRTSDSAALELLFWRHGPLVWSVCRRILGASADAEDAFQATFVVLARKARTIANRAAFAGWLHRVAWRTALTVRKTRYRLMSREFPIENAGGVHQDDDPSLRLQSAEENEILDRELARLPQKYRLPLILCDLENWTRDAAAVELNCPIGTLNSRLSRGRDMLRLRLQRCGVTFAGLTAVLMMPPAVSATWQRLCAGPSTAVQQLADSTIRSMALMGVKKAFAALALSGMLIAGTAMMALGLADGPKNPPPPVKDSAKDLPIAPEKKKEAASRFIDPHGAPLPEGAVARIGSSRLRHADVVTGLRYSPDGKWLASVSTSAADATARLWDADTGKQQLVVTVKTGDGGRRSAKDICRDLGFSKDGKQFFVIDTESFRAFDIAGGNELFAHAFPKNALPKNALPKNKKKPGVGPGDLIGAAISPDGKTYVLIQRHGLIEIRDVGDGKVLKTTEHPFQMYPYASIEFSPDGRHFVAGEREVANEQLSLPVIEVATGKIISRIEGADLFSSLRFVPGTDNLVGLGAYKPTKRVVNLVDWRTGKSLRSIDVDSTTSALAVSPDGKSLIAGTAQRTFCQIIDIGTGKELARIPSTFSLTALAFSPDGKLLAGIRAFSGAISVWDMATRDYHATAAEPVSFHGVHFGADSNSLAIPERDHPLIDWRTGAIIERLTDTSERPGLRAGLSPDRRWFAKRTFAKEEMSIAVVDSKTGKEFRNFKGHKQFVQSLSFSRDGSRLASGSYDKTIRVWSLKDGNEIAQFTAPELTGHEHIALSDNGRIMAVGVTQGIAYGSGSIILIWDVDARKRLARVEAETWFFAEVAISPDGKWLAAGGGEDNRNRGQKPEETAVHIWETATGRPVHALPGHNCKYVHPGAHCAFSLDSRLLVTGDAAGKLRIWEVLSGQEVRSFAGHHSTVTARFSPDGKLLVAASDDAPCFIWDVINASNKVKPMTAAELQGSWNDLGLEDARKAFQAIERLAANPDRAVELIRKNLKTAVAIDPKRLEMLIGDLVSDQFAQRKSATAELTRIAEHIEPALREKLGSTNSEEERTRLESILKTLETPTPKRIEESRALSALEFIGNAEAIRLLEELAGGAKGYTLTQAASDTCERLRRRAR